MGKVITVMNMKGGVGKTTVSAHIAGAAAVYRLGAEANRKVLVIDYDPQFNLSQMFLPHTNYFQLEKARKTTLAILMDDDAELNPYILQVPGNESPPKVHTIATRVLAYKNTGTLDLVPSTLDLMYVALGQAETQLKPIENRFEKFIDECKLIYDLIIIDCHPAGSLFTKTSLRNSDHVLIPVVPQRYAVRGIGLMMNFIESKKHGANGPKPHVLFNSTSRVGISKEEAQIRADTHLAGYCLSNTLKRYTAFSDPEEGKGFVWQSKKPYSTEALRNLIMVTKEILTKIEVLP